MGRDQNMDRTGGQLVDVNQWIQTANSFRAVSGIWSNETKSVLFSIHQKSVIEITSLLNHSIAHARSICKDHSHGKHTSAYMFEISVGSEISPK